MKISSYLHQLLDKYTQPIVIPPEFPSAWETFRLGAPIIFLIAIWFFLLHR